MILTIFKKSWLKPTTHYIDEDPFCSIFLVSIRNVTKAAVFRFVATFSGCSQSKISLALSGICCGSDIATVDLLDSSQKRLVQAYLLSKGQTEAAAIHNISKSRFMVWNRRQIVQTQIDNGTDGFKKILSLF